MKFRSFSDWRIEMCSSIQPVSPDSGDACNVSGWAEAGMGIAPSAQIRTATNRMRIEALDGRVPEIRGPDPWMVVPGRATTAAGS